MKSYELWSANLSWDRLRAPETKAVDTRTRERRGRAARFMRGARVGRVVPRKKAAAPAPDGAAPDAPLAKKPRAKKAAAPKAAPPSDEGVHKERIVFPRETYNQRKDDIKAPIKQHELKWQFLGEGKGRYHKDGVNVFVMFTDAGVDYSVWGSDAATVDALLSAWRGIVGEKAFAQAEKRGEEAAVAEAARAESEAMRLWKLQEPQRRPGEPDFFFKKRTDEWQAKRPDA